MISKPQYGSYKRKKVSVLTECLNPHCLKVGCPALILVIDKK